MTYDYMRNNNYIKMHVLDFLVKKNVLGGEHTCEP